MQRKYVTKKLIKRMSLLTNNLYKQSIIDIMGYGPNVTDEEVHMFMRDLRLTKYSINAGFTDEQYTYYKSKLSDIDELYLDKMVQLSSDDLQDILFLHKHGKPLRAERTLDMIMSELARRALFGDSSQSDTIYKNGDVDVGQKSTDINKKTPNKRNKSNKSK